MKNKIALTLMALGLALPVMNLNAQDDPRPPRPPRRERPQPPEDGAPGAARPRPMVPPMFAALDKNHDGVIDATELAGAVEALKALDKNADGRITLDEVRPAGRGPRGDRGPEGVRPPPPGERADAAETAPEDVHARPRRERAGAPEDRPGRPGMPPVIGALDANHDGLIDATEIANASAALKSLDKNGDGQLTAEELHPGGGPRGFRGPGPRGPRPPAE